MTTTTRDVIFLGLVCAIPFVAYRTGTWLRWWLIGRNPFISEANVVMLQNAAFLAMAAAALLVLVV